jgi:hypothetical protein
MGAVSPMISTTKIAAIFRVSFIGAACPKSDQRAAIQSWGNDRWSDPL